MGFLKFFKDWKELHKKISISFKKRDDEISGLKKSESEQDKKIARLEGMMLVLMKEASAEKVQVSAKTKEGKVQKEEVALPIRLKKGYKKKQILEEIQNLSNQGYSVTEIEEAIINKFGISRRTFYNYKKKLIVNVRVQG